MNWDDVSRSHYDTTYYKTEIFRVVLGYYNHANNTVNLSIDRNYCCSDVRILVVQAMVAQKENLSDGLVYLPHNVRCVSRV
jgi:hypothetical protein